MEKMAKRVKMSLNQLEASPSINLSLLTKCPFNCSLNSDIIFVFEEDLNKRVFAHSALLKTLNSKLNKQFKSNFGLTSEIPITEISYDGCLQCVRFMYNQIYLITQDNVFEIMVGAEMFGLELLLNKCIQKVEKELSIVFACTSLEYVISIGQEYLLQKILKFIGSRLEQILKTTSFLNIQQETLEIILGLENIAFCSEKKIFEGAMKWAKAQCMKNAFPIDGLHNRMLLGKAFNLIRFPIMTREEFHDCETKNPDLFTMDEIRNLSIYFTRKISAELTFPLVPRNQFNACQEILIINNNCCWSKYYASTVLRSKMTVNKDTVIYSIIIANPEISQNAIVQIYEGDFKKVCKIQGKVNSVTSEIKMREAVVLIRNKTYTISIKYENISCKLYCSKQKIIPWTKKVGNTSFCFSSLTRLLLAIKFEKK